VSAAVVVRVPEEQIGATTDICDVLKYSNDASEQWISGN
jgi:hypothetical protein